MNKPHPQAEFIIAKANGATIQYNAKTNDLSEGGWCYMDENDYSFHDNMDYRIKPEPVYPVTRMTDEELYIKLTSHFEPTKMLNINIVGEGAMREGLHKLANAAIRRAIQDGDVVLPGEKE